MYAEFLQKLNDKWINFMNEAAAGAANKTAALRARKAAREVRKDLRDFKNLSLAAVKALPGKVVVETTATAAPVAEPVAEAAPATPAV